MHCLLKGSYFILQKKNYKIHNLITRHNIKHYNTKTNWLNKNCFFKSIFVLVICHCTSNRRKDTYEYHTFGNYTYTVFYLQAFIEIRSNSLMKNSTVVFEVLASVHFKWKSDHVLSQKVSQIMCWYGWGRGYPKFTPV